jgi:hypothetical protein
MANKSPPGFDPTRRLVTIKNESHPAFDPLRWSSILSEAAFSTFMNEFEGESDRAAAVLAGAYLDDGLAKLLQMRLIGSKRFKDELLGQDRPLGTFSARIKAAYAVGVVSDSGYHDLELIRKIRNTAAHHLVGFSFERAEIVSWCGRLLLPQWWPAKFSPNRTPRVRFNLSVCMLVMVNAAPLELCRPIEQLVLDGQVPKGGS